MKDLNELIGKLKVEFAKRPELSREDKDALFEIIIREIEAFYTENLKLSPYEVAIFLTNKEKTVLSFACPEYMVNSGMIPVVSTEALTAKVYRSGQGFIDNKLENQRRLIIFEIIRTPEGKVLPLWKMMTAPISVDDDKLGVIEISRRARTADEAGEDFSPVDFQFLEKTIKILAQFIKKTMPDNFRGKIS